MVARGGHSRVWGLVLLLALGGLARAGRAQDLRVPAPNAPSAEVLSWLAQATPLVSGLDGAGVSALAGHSDAVVRAALCRFLGLHPELDGWGALTALSRDSTSQVRDLALLALAASSSPESLLRLEEGLSAADPGEREAAAIGVLTREALSGHDTRLPPPGEALTGRARVALVSEMGRDWSGALDHYERLVDLESQWTDLQAEWHALEQDASVGQCAQYGYANPGLLSAASAETAVSAPQRPTTVIIASAQTNPRLLLLSGRHDELAETLFDRQNDLEALAGFVARLQGICQSAWPPTEPQVTLPNGVPGVPIGPELVETRLQLGVELAVTNHPAAYRPVREGFLLGEDVEVSVLPRVTLHHHDGDGSDISRELSWREAIGVTSGIDLLGRFGWYFSGGFFQDRTRPTAMVTFQVADWTSGTPGYDEALAGVHASFSGEISPGTDDVYGDLTRFPAPHVLGRVRVTHYRLERNALIYELGAHVTYVQHILDDEVSPPRDELWLEPGLDGQWWFTDSQASVRWGVLGDATWRSAADGDDAWTSALASDVSLAIRVEDGGLQLTGWVGPGLLASFEEGQDPTVIAVGGLQGDYQEGVESDLAILFGVSMERDARALGRIGRVGAVERASAHIGFSLPDAIHEAVGMDLFIERGAPTDVDDEIAWGGLGVSVPLGFVEVDQEITYRMTYAALIDESRFEDNAQEVLEAMIWAASWF